MYLMFIDRDIYPPKTILCPNVYMYVPMCVYMRVCVEE